MPLVRISLRQDQSADFKRALGDAVHQALVETANVPPLDRFQIITDHPPEELIYDPSYLGIARTDGIVIVQITLNAGRTVDVKKALYARMAALLHERLGLRREDLVISLVEVAKENWSFGNGDAPYA